MNINLFGFLDEHKEEIFHYFKENSVFFPNCCVDIALMLKHFIREYFGEEFEIVHAKKILYANRKKFHIWIQQDNNIIDFSLFQFYVGNNKFRKVSSAETYIYCIEEIQRGDVIFNTTYYNKLFKEIILADSQWLLSQYKKSLWDFPINKDLSAIDSIRQYFKDCKELLI